MNSKRNFRFLQRIDCTKIFEVLYLKIKLECDTSKIQLRHRDNAKFSFFSRVRRFYNDIKPTATKIAHEFECGTSLC